MSVKRRREKQLFLKRSKKVNKHHLLPEARGGKWSVDNILMWDTVRHAAWHLLFGIKTFPEVASLLLRAWNIKKKTNYKIVEEYNGGGNS